MDARRNNFPSPIAIRLLLAAGVLACIVGMAALQLAVPPDGVAAPAVISYLDHRGPWLDEPGLASPAALPALIELSMSRIVMMEVTAYCPCPKCCGPNARGITASGKTVDYADGRFVAADTAIFPFGTRFSVPGYHGGTPVEVVDRGGAIKGNKLDVFFPSHQTAVEWGRRQLAVSIVD